MFQKSYTRPRGRFTRSNNFNRFGGSKGRSNGNGSHGPTNPSRYIHKPSEVLAEVDNTPVTHKFEDFALHPQLKQNIITRGYTSPTPIQDQSIPYILEGRDVVGIANTGTGKTAAFLLPLINKIMQNRSQKALIIAPTRELAVQIEEELRLFSRGIRMTAVLCIGGASLHRQLSVLRQNPDIVISTPGRLMDLIERRAVRMDTFNNVVLDEVDRMLDIGFVHDIRRIIGMLPQTRQSLFFSATVSTEIHSLIKSFVHDAVTVSVKIRETAAGIEQDIIRVNRNDKIPTLASMLQKEEFSKVIVFGRTKWGVERLAKALSTKGIPAASIHGNKSQSQRLSALNQFKSNQVRVLVATDVAARGLDIEDVSHVINFDEPGTYDEYIHRIGRTGRANKQGKALTFIE